jgi:hypothetical protein
MLLPGGKDKGAGCLSPEAVGNVFFFRCTNGAHAVCATKLALLYKLFLGG